MGCLLSTRGSGLWWVATHEVGSGVEEKLHIRHNARLAGRTEKRRDNCVLSAVGSSEFQAYRSGAKSPLNSGSNLKESLCRYSVNCLSPSSGLVLLAIQAVELSLH
jgi:hypothetical protein